MSEDDYKIAVDAEVGQRIEQMAKARGISARDLVATMVTEGPDVDEPAVLEQLELLWASVEAGGEAVFADEDVGRWLSTWGTREFKPWSTRGR